MTNRDKGQKTKKIIKWNAFYCDAKNCSSCHSCSTMRWSVTLSYGSCSLWSKCVCSLAQILECIVACLRPNMIMHSQFINNHYHSIPYFTSVLSKEVLQGSRLTLATMISRGVLYTMDPGTSM